MANPIIKILRGAGAPPTLEAGRIAIDQLNKNLVVGIDDGNGGTINEIVGGSGTFATKAFVSDAVTTATGNLGTMSTQNANSVEITGGNIDGTAIGETTPATGKFTALDVGGGSVVINGWGGIELLNPPTSPSHATRKDYVDNAISALGSVFHYVGVVSAATGNDLTTLSDQNTGAYYRADVAGTYTAGADSFAAKVGDAFVKTSTGWQKIDNVDVEVLGTEGQITVTGDENTGYTVGIHSQVLSGIQYAALTAQDASILTQNIDPQATTYGFTKLNGSLSVALDTLGEFKVSHQGYSAIRVSGNNVYLNEDGTVPVTSNGTLVITNTGLGQQQGPDGTYIAINADNRIKNSAGGLDITGNSIITGDLVVTGTLNDVIIDGGTY